MEKLTLECPVPFTVTVMAEILLYFTMFCFDVYLMDQFNIISITTWTSHGFSALFIQSPMRERGNQRMALQRTYHGLSTGTRQLPKRIDLTNHHKIQDLF
jgi:hypothetical protein